MRRRSRSSRQRRNGVAAVEFAVCLPMLVLALLGMLDCCSMVFLKQSLAVAAYEGAHTALQPGATSADVQAVCTQILRDRRVRSGSIQITPRPEGTPEGQYFTVSVSAPTRTNSVLPTPILRGRRLTSSATMMKETEP
jgi:Flp pilus assembly protein TadG